MTTTTASVVIDLSLYIDRVDYFDWLIDLLTG